MQNGRILLALFTLVLASCAPAHHGSAQPYVRSDAAIAGILGGWDADTTSYFFGDKESLHVFEDMVLVTKVCRSWAKVAVVKVSAPARVSGSHIEVLAPAYKSSLPGEAACEAKIDAGLMTFQIQNDKLLFTPVLGKTYVYGRREKPRSSSWSTSPPGNRYQSSAASRNSRARAVVDLGNLLNSWSQSSGDGSSNSSNTYRATSRPSTRTVTNSYGTGVIRNSGRSRAVRIK